MPDGYELYEPGGDEQGEEDALSMPCLIVGPAPDGVFKAMQQPPRWAFAVVAVAAQSKDDMKQLAALVQLTTALVVKDERVRLNEYLMENDEAMDKLQAAISQLSDYWSGRPLELSPASSDSSPKPAPEPQSRVVSLSKGTVRVVPPTPPPGGPENSGA